MKGKINPALYALNYLHTGRKMSIKAITINTITRTITILNDDTSVPNTIGIGLIITIPAPLDSIKEKIKKYELSAVFPSD